MVLLPRRLPPLGRDQSGLTTQWSGADRERDVSGRSSFFHYQRCVCQHPTWRQGLSELDPVFSIKSITSGHTVSPCLRASVAEFWRVLMAVEVVWVSLGREGFQSTDPLTIRNPFGNIGFRGSRASSVSWRLAETVSSWLFAPGH